MLSVVSFILGPVETNSYLVADDSTCEAAVIDPAGQGELILEEAVRRGWRVGHIWLTHGHFDHLGGAAAVADGTNPSPPVAMHPEDYWLWRNEGGAPFFGLRIDPGPEPTIDFFHGQILRLGKVEFEVRHTPGHTPGHVVFHCPVEKILFCGDVIFMGSIGRTDLPGGSFEILMESIRTQILSLPDETRLFPGHGPETTIGYERIHNPFLYNNE
jgi:hydroxyacylglutathione hydrolase